MKKYTVEQLAEMVQEVNGWDGSLEYFEYYEMEQINDLFHDAKPLEVLKMAHFGEFNWSDDFFTINAYGNLESINEFEFEKELQNNHDEIVETYFDLVESGEIENIL